MNGFTIFHLNQNYKDTNVIFLLANSTAKERAKKINKDTSS